MAQTNYGRSLSIPAAERCIAPIVAAVWQVFGVTPEQIVEYNRSGDVALARQVVMFLAVTRCRIALPSVAKAMQRRDHTTVLHARRQIEKRLATDPVLRAKVADVERRLGQLEGEVAA